MQTAVTTSQPTTDHQADQRSARVLAKTLYKELRQSGLEERAVLAVATELLGLIARDLREGA